MNNLTVLPPLRSSATLIGIFFLSACGRGMDLGHEKIGTLGIPGVIDLRDFVKISAGKGPSLLPLVSGTEGTFLLRPQQNSSSAQMNLVESPLGLTFDINDISLENSEFSWTLKHDFSDEENKYTTDKRLIYRGIEVSGAQIKSHQAHNSAPFALGQIPSMITDNGNGMFPNSSDFSLSQTGALEKAAKELSFHPWRFKFLNRIFVPLANALEPAYVFVVSASAQDPGRGPGVPLRVTVSGDSGEILSQVPVALHVNGQAILFPENNKVNQNPETVTLPYLSGDGSRLENEIFRVVNCMGGEPTSACQPTLDGASGGYSATWTSPKYDEMLTYFSLTRAVDWNRKMMSMGTQIGGTAWANNRTNFGLGNGKTLTVNVRALSRMAGGKTTPDNAQYLPGGPTGNGNPALVIGTGWEPAQGERRLLQYLGKDADVMMHEFGHHVVYRSVTEISGDSGGLHEGFADFFTYAITGNNNLGESIMSTGLPLRRGSLQGKIADYRSAPPHRAGEFWSSALWDVRVSLGVWKNGVNKADKIIWDSIDLLPSGPTYEQAILAIAKSAEIFADANGEDAIALKEKIYDVFAHRGFINPPNGSGSYPEASASSKATGAIASDGASKAGAKTVQKDSSSGGWCGVIGGTGSSRNGKGLILVMLLLPLFPFMASVMRKRLPRIPVRFRKRRS